MSELNQSSYSTVDDLNHPTTTVSTINPVLDENSSLTLILILAISSGVYVCILIAMLIARREMQPLKIKSPNLMIISIFAQLFIIVSVSVIQLSEEKCVNTQTNICKFGVLEMFALCFGYIMIAFTEPLAIISYVLRAFRLRRIYDA